MKTPVSIMEFLPDHNKSAELRAAIERLGRTEDVVRIALMPDAHVAEDVCVGTVTATTRRILPAAVGGDIGCGMVAVQLQCTTDVLADRNRAALVLAGFYERIPHALHASKDAPDLPGDWIALMGFLASYYQRPLGETVISSLPPRVRSLKPLPREDRNFWRVSSSAPSAGARGATRKDRMLARIDALSLADESALLSSDPNADGANRLQF